MRDRKVLLVILLLAGIALLVGCSPPGPGGSARSGSGEPTMTAILLPTRAATDTVAAGIERNEPEPTETHEAVPTVEPTATLSPQPSPSATPLTPTLAPTSVASPTPAPTKRPVALKPTASPELAGKLVFQTTVGGDFYVLQLGSDGPHADEPRRITDGIDPVWSPDGQWIAFIRWREPRGVWIVRVGGDTQDIAGTERRVFDWDKARWPSWSPDGEQILFSRQHGGKEEQQICFQGQCFTIPAQPYWKLGIVDVGDGAFSEPPGPNIAYAPSWSPDGEWIVYAGERGLTVQDVAGQTVVQITDATRDTGPAWSPDGTQVAFTRSQHDHWEIYVISFPDGPDAGAGSVTRLTETPQRPDGQPASSAAPAWSPDGKHLAFLTDRTGRWEIWVTAAPGSPAGRGPRPLFPSELEGLAVEYSYGGERALSWTQ